MTKEINETADRTLSNSATYAKWSVREAVMNLRDVVGYADAVIFLGELMRELHYYGREVPERE